MSIDVQCSTNSFTILSDNSVLIDSTKYNNCNRANPEPLTIKITNSFDPEGYFVQVVDYGFEFFIVSSGFSNGVAIVENLTNSKNISITLNKFSKTPGSFIAFRGTVAFTLFNEEQCNGISNLQPWKNGDQYSINFNGGFAPTELSLQFTRVKRTIPPHCLTNVVNPSLLQQNIEVPIVTIEGQSLIDGSDIGNMIFTVKDEIDYYHQKVPANLNHCQTYFIDQNNIKTTIFEQCCPKIVSVVKGKGATLYDKLWDIFDHENVGIFFENFYPNIIFYAMLKYILSRLLYGDFNINYLLGKYNDKFLADLAKSRFCGALPLFTECVDNICIYNYNQYFLFSLNN